MRISHGLQYLSEVAKRSSLEYPILKKGCVNVCIARTLLGNPRISYHTGVSHGRCHENGFVNVLLQNKLSCGERRTKTFANKIHERVKRHVACTHRIGPRAKRHEPANESLTFV